MRWQLGYLHCYVITINLVVYLSDITSLYDWMIFAGTLQVLLRLIAFCMPAKSIHFQSTHNIYALWLSSYLWTVLFSNGASNWCTDCPMVSDHLDQKWLDSPCDPCTELPVRIWIESSYHYQPVFVGCCCPLGVITRPYVPIVRSAEAKLITRMIRTLICTLYTDICLYKSSL